MERGRKTIVGGRSAAHRETGEIPRGIEVLLKKAKVDAPFRERCLRDPLAAAAEIELQLTESERKILATTPKTLLRPMIDNTFVPRHHVPTFLRKSSAAMLALVLGTVVIIPTYAGGVREIDMSQNVAPVDLAQARMASIQAALEQYRLDRGAYPTTEEWLAAANPLEEYVPLSVIQDPWMRRFHYVAVKNESEEVVNYRLQCLGRDPDDPGDNIPCPTDPDLHSFQEGEAQ
jgi:general secretion pathway protein G